jgi:putative Mg2+ transporter-C (MgtC) family protein
MFAFWDKVGLALQQDFVDMSDPGMVTQLTLRLVLAALLGGLLGFQRERVGKAAGARTHMLVAIGAALIALLPQQAGMTSADQSRVLQGLITGIGFLGAGAIIKLQDGDTVHGLTTAAGIWMTAAIGMSVGLGRGASALVATALTLLILMFVPHVSRQSYHGDGKKE